jgi:hypothetical protein
VNLKATAPRLLGQPRVCSSRERQGGADHPQQQQQQQHQQRWSTVESSPQQQQHQLLQHVLNLSDRRFKALAKRAPFLLEFEPQTLQVTVEALVEALHVRRTWAVCYIIELRPGILLTPWEPVQTLQMLADGLGLSSSHTGESVRPVAEHPKKCETDSLAG